MHEAQLQTAGAAASLIRERPASRGSHVLMLPPSAVTERRHRAFKRPELSSESTQRRGRRNQDDESCQR